MLANSCKGLKYTMTKDIVTNGKVVFLLLTEAFLAYVFSQMDLVLTMTAVKNYHWTIMQFGILTAVVVVSTSILLYNVHVQALQCVTMSCCHSSLSLVVHNLSGADFLVFPSSSASSSKISCLR